ncbi:hypothetical protein [Lacticaseibacillus rhamnosus]|nr:hypothetical protein [Lacticaseibacillus rhamnosus]AGP72273.1 Hypothetical protein LOCK900_2482 [Lacticaseibacillus rhamnosus LOCK900]
MPKQSVMAGRDFDAIWPCMTLTALVHTLTVAASFVTLFEY